MLKYYLVLAAARLYTLRHDILYSGIVADSKVVAAIESATNSISSALQLVKMPSLVISNIESVIDYLEPVCLGSTPLIAGTVKDVQDILKECKAFIDDPLSFSLKTIDEIEIGKFVVTLEPRVIAKLESPKEITKTEAPPSRGRRRRKKKKAMAAEAQPIDPSLGKW